MEFRITRCNSEVVKGAIEAFSSGKAGMTINGVFIPSFDLIEVEYQEAIPAVGDFDGAEENIAVSLYRSGEGVAAFGFNPETEICTVSYEGNFGLPSDEPFWMVEVDSVAEYVEKQKRFLDALMYLTEMHQRQQEEQDQIYQVREIPGRSRLAYQD